MDTSVFIIGLGILIFGAHFFNRIFSYTRVPNALLFIVFGIIIGPVLQLVVPADFGKMGAVFAAITLILLLFESGTNLSVAASKRAFGPSLAFTLFNFIASALIAGGVAYLFYEEMRPISAMFFGVTVAGTSSAIVIPMLQQIKTDEGSTTYLILESALTDVFCLVTGLAFLDAMAAGKVDSGTITLNISKAFFLATFIGLLAGYLWAVTLNMLRGLENNILINLGILFIIYGASEYYNLNGGIASLAFGFALGNSYLMSNSFLSDRWKPKPMLREEKILFSELVFVLATFFFVYIGINIIFTNTSIYVAALLIVVLILIVRPWSIKFSIYSKHSLRDIGIMSVMAPKGIVPAILASLPLQLGLSRDNEMLINQGQLIQNLTYAVILLSIIICTSLVIYVSTQKDGFSYMKRFFASITRHNYSETVHPTNTSMDLQNVMKDNPKSKSKTSQ